MEKKYDVFISYSRKDYEKDDQVIPDNPISAIKEMFDKNGVSYWIDKKGIYGGVEFMEEILDAIAASKILVFVSSKHSNESIYTCGEILEAINRGMHIIPVKIDDSPYNKKYKLVLNPYDFIDYKAKPITALPELLRAVNEEKTKLAEKEEETTKQQRIEAAKAEIKEKAEKYRALAGQIDFVTKELYSRSKLIGIKTKKCPICKKVVPIQSAYCNQCSWQFPKHYGIEGFDNIIEDDDAQMLLAQQIWQSHKDSNQKEVELKTLRNENSSLKQQVTDLKSKTEKGEVFTIGGIEFKMIHVEGGTFMMGANEGDSEAFDREKPTHQVTLSSYSIGETAVTQALWKAVMDNNPSRFKGADRPVENVSWDDCQEFIRKLNEKTNRKFRLPTEAEWEFAARGGNKSKGFKYAGSNNIDSVAWYDGNSGGETHPVAQKQPNELGLFDMSGNVYEWCQDWFGKYSNNSQTNPTGPKGGDYRVNRGGSWFNIARNCRTSFRSFNSPSFHFDYLGLRLAL